MENCTKVIIIIIRRKVGSGKQQSPGEGEGMQLVQDGWWDLLDWSVWRGTKGSSSSCALTPSLKNPLCLSHTELCDAGLELY